MKENTVPMRAGGKFGASTLEKIGIFVPGEESIQEHECPLFSKNIIKATTRHMALIEKKSNKNKPVRINSDFVKMIIEHDRLCNAIAREMSNFSARQWQIYKWKLLLCVKASNIMCAVRRGAIEHLNKFKQGETEVENEAINHAVFAVNETIIADIWDMEEDPIAENRAEYVRKLTQNLTKQAIMRACTVIEESGAKDCKVFEFVRNGAEVNF